MTGGGDKLEVLFGSPPDSDEEQGPEDGDMLEAAIEESAQDFLEAVKGGSTAQAVAALRDLLGLMREE